MRAFLAPLTVFLLTVPAVFADPGAWYEESSVLITSAGAVYDGDNVWVWAEAGDVIVAEFTWDNADGSATTWIEEGGNLCPIQDVDCLVATTLDTQAVLCPSHIRYSGSTTSPQTVSVTAANTGYHRVQIVGVVIPVSLAYHMHVSVDGAAPSSVVTNSMFLGTGSGNHLWCPLL